LQTVLFLIALAALAYVLAHLVVERLQARFLVAGGAEYLVLGFLLGPVMPWGAAIGQHTLDSLHPVMSLVIGGVGLLMGLQANFRALLLREDDATQLSITTFIATAGTVGLGCYSLLHAGLLGGHPGPEAAAGAWVLAASASVSSAGAMVLVQRRYGASGSLTELLRGTVQSSELLSIAAFGVVFCVYHAPDPAHLSWTYANWLLVTVGLGVGLGILFRWFIGDEYGKPEHVFLAVLGIIVFASGAAHYLDLSPLLVNLILGMTLANISRVAGDVEVAMARMHRPVSIMLLVLAGALWRPIPLTGLVVVAAYLLLRFSSKMLGGWAGAASGTHTLPRDLGRGLLGQGDVAVAMVLSYRIVFPGPVVDIVFTAVLSSVLLSELTSARQLRALLIDSGDIGRDEPGSGVPGSGVPGSGVPGSGVPGSGEPGSGVPGSGEPGSGSAGDPSELPDLTGAPVAAPAPAPAPAPEGA